tara:strand:- start:2595 stop:4121 length:1527 start_codon:yes stop_codon:yes gene_type:complete
MAIHIDSDGNFYFGASGTTDFDNLSYTPVFSVTKDGVVTAQSGTVGGISLASDHIKSTNYSNTSGSEAGFKIDSNGDAFFNKVDIRIGGAASQNPSTGFTTLDIGSAKLSEYNDDLWVNSKRVLIFDQDATASANSPSLFLFAAYGQPGWYVDDSQINRTKLYYSNGVNNVFHTESDNTYLHLDGSGIQVGTATGGNSQYIGKNSSGTFGWHNLPSGNDHPDSDHTGFAASSHGTHVSFAGSGGNLGDASTVARSNHSHSSSSTSINGLSGSLSLTTADSTAKFAGGFTTIGGSEIRLNRSTSGYISTGNPSGSSPKIGVSTSNRFSNIYSQSFYGTFYGPNINSSSRNIKENIVDTALGLDFINDLEVKDFTMINTEEYGTKKYTGFIAEDLQDYLTANNLNYRLVDDYSESYEFDQKCSHIVVCETSEVSSCEDECCSSYPNRLNSDDERENYLHATLEECEAYMPDENRHPHLYINNLIGPLVKAVQELSTQVSDLTARIEALEG